MSLLQAYLRNPKTQRVLSRKPGDKGFSLIELVVVVAVLAILAAIAIPNFTSISADAAHAAAKNTLSVIAKECSVNFAQNTAGATYAQIAGGSNVHYNSTTTTRACGTSADPNAVCAFVNAGTPATYCVDLDGSKITTGLITAVTGQAGASLQAAWDPATSATIPNPTTW